ncbi:RNA-binding S4 domain-containing protein [Microbaculum marinum]|uniref:RNA-binding S4 domain-containing protein n=1 Tax=Microbaculum marinum TaxID=1764581 RepID=A0AAW9RN22_9HYPH
MSDSQRIDKWLWHARVAKTRTLAAELVSGGHVRLNRTKVGKPSQIVRHGDVVTIAVRDTVRILRIEAIAERRGPASQAATTYTDLSPPTERTETPAAGAIHRPRGAGRPTKRDRRQMDAWKEHPRMPDDGEI